MISADLLTERKAQIVPPTFILSKQMLDTNQFIIFTDNLD